MKWKQKLAALLMVPFAASLVMAGCGGAPAPTEPETELVQITAAPAAPKSLKASAEKQVITLQWEPVEHATGYELRLYNEKTKKYEEIASQKETSYVYTAAEYKDAEFKFAVYTYLQSGWTQKFYSEKASKVTAKVETEKVNLNRERLSVEIGKTGTIKATVTPDGSVPVTWSSDNAEVAAVDAEGKVSGLAEGTAVITAETAEAKAECTVVVKEKIAVPEGKLIAITFDDGPSAKYTGKLLDALKKYDAKATFFLVGRNVAGNEALVKRMLKEGHEVGNHSWSHADLASISKKEMQAEVDKTDKAVYKASGAYPSVFRAPYGSLSDALLDHLDVPSIYWSVDTLDWQTKDKNYVKKQILDNAYDGAIILLHDIHETSVDGAIVAIKQLQDEGYTLVTVSQLLSRNGGSADAGVTYFDCEPAE